MSTGSFCFSITLQFFQKFTFRTRVLRPDRRSFQTRYFGDLGIIVAFEQTQGENQAATVGQLVQSGFYPGDPDGRFTGGNTEYNHLPNGARVIVMKEGARSFITWIRTKGGEIVDKTVYPDSYVKDDWRKRPLVTE